MRLINVKTKKLESFSGGRLPFYAILSHTWEEGELGFQEWQSGPDTTKAGYAKIYNACSQAQRQRLDYCWVDTVCIDKSSSTELSEAITSMFSWYHQATVCFAYLADVSDDRDACVRPGSEFRRSKWFTRGWTLQELIAPHNVTFYSKDWMEIAQKADVAEVICEITQISPGIIEKRSSLGSFSIAQRMSWAAKRITTRVEDAAYCLLGIFDVSLPLLYGEGSKAFLRLQEEIIRHSDDESIFAWTCIPSLSSAGLESRRLQGYDTPAHLLKDEDLSPKADDPEFPSTRVCSLIAHPFWFPHGGSSALAPDPCNFYSSGVYEKGVTEGERAIASPFSVTNAGLSITSPLVSTLPGHVENLTKHTHPITGKPVESADLGGDPMFFWVLRCSILANNQLEEQYHVCIPLYKVYGDVFQRSESPNAPQALTKGRKIVERHQIYITAYKQRAMQDHHAEFSHGLLPVFPSGIFRAQDTPTSISQVTESNIINSMPIVQQRSLTATTLCLPPKNEPTLLIFKNPEPTNNRVSRFLGMRKAQNGVGIIFCLQSNSYLPPEWVCRILLLEYTGNIYQIAEAESCPTWERGPIVSAHGVTVILERTTGLSRDPVRKGLRLAEIFFDGEEPTPYILQTIKNRAENGRLGI